MQKEGDELTMETTYSRRPVPGVVKVPGLGMWTDTQASVENLVACLSLTAACSTGKKIKTYQLPGLDGTPRCGHGLTRSPHAGLRVCAAARHVGQVHQAILLVCSWFPQIIFCSFQVDYLGPQRA
jgi:hypothetical protein